MDFALTSEQKEYQKEIVSFAKRHLNLTETLEVFSPELWKEIAEFGLFGITADVEYGGLNESYVTTAVAMEALGFGCQNNGLVFAVTNHIWVALNMIGLHGADEIKKKYLPNMISGKMIGALAITEAEAGSDALAMQSYAEQADNGYILNGSKMFISNGTIADIFIVIVRTSRDTSDYTAFIVERKFDGVKTGTDIPTMGLSACPLSEVILTDCFVPAQNVLGKIGDGGFIMTDAIEWERLFEFAPHVGAMQRVIDRCVQYSEERKQFSQPLNSFQAVSNKIADMMVWVELARNMMYKVAWMKDQGKNAFREASIFKLFVSEHYIQACRDAMQIFGAYGYTKEYGIEREWRDAMACSIYSGTNEMQRNTIFKLFLPCV